MPFTLHRLDRGGDRDRGEARHLRHQYRALDPGPDRLARGEELARADAPAPGHRQDRARRVEALGDDPRLVLIGPAAPPADAGDQLDAPKAVDVRTGRTTMSTHRSRACSCRLGP